jgi:hypothetical protein
LPTTKFIEVSTDTTCSIAIGPSPGVVGTGSAGLSNQRLQTNERVIRRIPTGYVQYPGNGFIATPTSLSIFTTANV